METYKSAQPTNIPLCEPNLKGNEKEYSAAAIDSNWLSGGHFLNLFEQKISEFTGAKYVVGVSSGTTALQISLILAGVERNDLVIIPNLTFVATANSVKYLNADPILVDINPYSWVLDLNLLKDFLKNETYLLNGSCYYKLNNRRIKAVITVHLLGNMCAMEELLSLGKQYQINVIEDAACSLGSFQGGQHSGTFGLVGTLSFNSNKIITTGGGGAILTNDENLAKKARYLISQAKSPGIEYLHSDLGYNYRLVNPLAAIGVAQMEQLDKFIERKKSIAISYFRNLSLTGSQIQTITPNTDSNIWHFVLLTKKSRELITYLSEQNIESRPVWIPINELPIFRNDTYIFNQNHSKDISETGVMLPCSTSITDEQIMLVCKSIDYFFKNL